MTNTKTEELALAYGRGEVAAQTVIDAVVAAPPSGGPRYTPARTYDEVGRRMETDESAPFNPEGWGGVTAMYVADGLTDDQYAELLALYVNRLSSGA